MCVLIHKDAALVFFRPLTNSVSLDKFHMNVPTRSSDAYRLRRDSGVPVAKPSFVSLPQACHSVVVSLEGQDQPSFMNSFKLISPH
jgi:hypothetical protein